jgi:drug/metabolite transporter (DMT)-like permease
MPIPGNQRGPRGGVVAAMLTLYFVWGSTYVGIAVAVETIPPFLMAATRFGIAGAILLAWSIAREGNLSVLPTRHEWRDSAIVGGLLLGGGMGLVAFGEQTIPSGITALLVAMMPVWVAIFGRLVFGERLPWLATAGIALGFVGVAILVGPTAFGDVGALEPLGLMALVVAPIAWSVGSLFASHRADLPHRSLVATAAQMLTGGVVLLAMSVAAGELGTVDIGAISSESLWAFAYLTIVGSLIAFTAFGWLLRVAPLPLVTTYAYVNPVVAVVLGALILQESIDPRTLIAGAVIVVAVMLIVTARGRMRAPRTDPAPPTLPTPPATIVAVPDHAPPVTGIR